MFHYHFHGAVVKYGILCILVECWYLKDENMAKLLKHKIFFPSILSSLGRKCISVGIHTQYTPASITQCNWASASIHDQLPVSIMPPPPHPFNYKSLLLSMLAIPFYTASNTEHQQ